MRSPLRWLQSGRARADAGRLLAPLATRVRGRSCLVLGSAPDPTPPRLPLASGTAVFCVNCAGYSASQLGLATPEVTLLRSKKLIHPDKEPDRRALRGLTTRHLVLVQSDDAGSPLDTYIDRLAELDFRYDALSAMSIEHRAAVVEHVTGRPLGRGRRETSKSSSGIAAACIALFLGAREVVLAGFSLDSAGLSYVSGPSARHHVKPDREALVHMRAAGLPMRTTEPRLAELTGLPLIA